MLTDERRLGSDRAIRRNISGVFSALGAAVIFTTVGLWASGVVGGSTNLSVAIGGLVVGLALALGAAIGAINIIYGPAVLARDTMSFHGAALQHAVPIGELWYAIEVSRDGRPVVRLYHDRQCVGGLLLAPFRYEHQQYSAGDTTKVLDDLGLLNSRSPLDKHGYASSGSVASD